MNDWLSLPGGEMVRISEIASVEDCAPALGSYRRRTVLSLRNGRTIIAPRNMAYMQRQIKAIEASLRKRDDPRAPGGTGYDGGPGPGPGGMTMAGVVFQTAVGNRDSQKHIWYSTDPAKSGARFASLCDQYQDESPRGSSTAQDCRMCRQQLFRLAETAMHDVLALDKGRLLRWHQRVAGAAWDVCRYAREKHQLLGFAIEKLQEALAASLDAPTE